MKTADSGLRLFGNRGWAWAGAPLFFPEGRWGESFKPADVLAGKALQGHLTRPYWSAGRQRQVAACLSKI